MLRCWSPARCEHCAVCVVTRIHIVTRARGWIAHPHTLHRLRLPHRTFGLARFAHARTLRITVAHFCTRTFPHAQRLHTRLRLRSARAFGLDWVAFTFTFTCTVTVVRTRFTHILPPRSPHRFTHRTVPGWLVTRWFTRFTVWFTQFWLRFGCAGYHVPSWFTVYRFAHRTARTRIRTVTILVVPGLYTVPVLVVTRAPVGWLGLHTVVARVTLRLHARCARWLLVSSSCATHSLRLHTARYTGCYALPGSHYRVGCWLQDSTRTCCPTNTPALPVDLDRAYLPHLPHTRTNAR